MEVKDSKQFARGELQACAGLEAAGSACSETSGGGKHVCLTAAPVAASCLVFLQEGLCTNEVLVVTVHDQTQPYQTGRRSSIALLLRGANYCIKYVSVRTVYSSLIV